MTQNRDRCFKPGGRSKEWIDAVNKRSKLFALGLLADNKTKDLAWSDAKIVIEQNKQLFANAFLKTLDESKDDDAMKALPDVAFELVYGTDRSAWRGKSFVLARAETKEAYCNYGLESVFRMPDPEQPLTPLIISMGFAGDDSKKRSFEVRWLDKEGQVCTAPEAYGSEMHASCFVMWFCEQHKLKLPEVKLVEAPLQTYQRGATMARTKVVDSVLACFHKGQLTVPLILQALLEMPDLDGRLAERKELKLAQLIASARQADKAAEALVKAVKGQYDAKLHEPLIRAVYTAEPRRIATFISLRAGKELWEKVLLAPVLEFRMREQAEALAKELSEHKRVTRAVLAALDLYSTAEKGLIAKALQMLWPDAFKIFEAGLYNAKVEEIADKLFADFIDTKLVTEGREAVKLAMAMNAADTADLGKRLVELLEQHAKAAKDKDSLMAYRCQEFAKLLQRMQADIESGFVRLNFETILTEALKKFKAGAVADWIGLTEERYGYAILMHLRVGIAKQLSRGQLADEEREAAMYDLSKFLAAHAAQLAEKEEQHMLNSRAIDADTLPLELPEGPLEERKGGTWSARELGLVPKDGSARELLVADKQLDKDALDALAELKLDEPKFSDEYDTVPDDNLFADSAVGAASEPVAAVATDLDQERMRSPTTVIDIRNQSFKLSYDAVTKTATGTYSCEVRGGAGIVAALRHQAAEGKKAQLCALTALRGGSTSAHPPEVYAGVRAIEGRGDCKAAAIMNKRALDDISKFGLDSGDFNTLDSDSDKLYKQLCKVYDELDALPFVEREPAGSVVMPDGSVCEQVWTKAGVWTLAPSARTTPAKGQPLDAAYKYRLGRAKDELRVAADLAKSKEEIGKQIDAIDAAAKARLQREGKTHRSPTKEETQQEIEAALSEDDKQNYYTELFDRVSGAVSGLRAASAEDLEQLRHRMKCISMYEPAPAAPQPGLPPVRLQDGVLLLPPDVMIGAVATADGTDGTIVEEGGRALPVSTATYMRLHELYETKGREALTDDEFKVLEQIHPTLRRRREGALVSLEQLKEDGLELTKETEQAAKEAGAPEDAVAELAAAMETVLSGKADS
jgi:hypothetical protein